MKKQYLTVLLSVIMIFSLIGCESGDAKQDQTTQTETTKAEITDAETTEAETTETETTEAEASEELQLPTIEPTVLYDQDGLKVTADKIDFDAISNYSLYLTFENNSSETYEVSNGNMLIEDVYIGLFGAIGSIECAPGETKTDYLTIDSYEIEAMGLNTLGTMRFPLEFEHENRDLSINTDYITLETSDSGKAVPQLNDEGIEIINDAGFRVVGLGIIDGISSKEYAFYIENNTDEDAFVSTENSTQNGAESAFYFSTDIPQNSKCISSGYMSDESLAALIKSNELTSLVSDIVVTKEMFSYDAITKATGVELMK